ncbi:hypothetical protein ABL840_31355 [Variovorax sp. NFACC27]|uniref:hypothetical protein n=1 Tax=unclassified Variovorax TaxID=663243 RepID=UPI00089953C9|nr:hypothetical protein SAMN03159371_02858 [Variovorax sp. NFACC28]SEG63772.1 hypothetical protein SAMN03159365_02938 [Variovorax sp. NFACC29]SFC65997.1 hypothetical protein SAMN03159379_02828 [Variovorax sp. NFACC26]SFG81950.1 hypothetical protein SAMN03159447_05069 [Variovorax sp. NFACC27]
MKHICPRCKEPGIGGLAKRWSSRAVPAECSACGGLSHVLASTSSGIWVGGIVIFMVSLIGGLGLHSGLFFVSGLVLAVAFNVWAWRRAKMYPISRESAGNAAKAGWLVAGIYAFVALFQ